jgi:PleD family two-component response regulator
MEYVLRSTCKKMRTLDESSRLNLSGESLSVSISAGDKLLQPGDPSESNVHRADNLMYQIKQSGRNRVKVG